MPRDCRVKLIVPPSFEDYESFFTMPAPFLPYGIATLTAFLRNNGCNVEQEDLSLKFNHHKYEYGNFIKYRFDLRVENYEQYIDEYLYSPDNLTTPQREKLDLLAVRVLNSTDLNNFNLIGLSISSFPQFIFALVLSKKIKETSNIPIVLGGFFITLFVQLYPDIFRFIDYAVIGEGQVPLLKLIEHLENGVSILDVPNLLFNRDNNIIANPLKDFPIEDMPIPDFIL